LLFGFCIRWFSAWHEGSERMRKTLAPHRTLLATRSYSNPIPAIAFVVLEATTNGYIVNVDIEMEHPGGTGYRRESVGKVSSLKDALSNWGFVEWRDDGLHVGKGSNEFFVPHNELEGGR
jgi:hypothetical protein